MPPPERSKADAWIGRSAPEAAAYVAGAVLVWLEGWIAQRGVGQWQMREAAELLRTCLPPAQVSVVAPKETYKCIPTKVPG